MSLPDRLKLGIDGTRAYAEAVRLRHEELEGRKAKARNEVLLYIVGFIVITAAAGFGAWYVQVLAMPAIIINGVLLTAAERRYRVAAILLDLLEEW